MDDEERGRDGIDGIEVEEFCSDGGGGEGCPHRSQVAAIEINILR